MIELMEARKQFNRDVVTSGIRKAGDIRTMYPLGSSLKAGTMERWLDKLITPSLDGNIEFPKEWRCVNRFLVGADPEFVLVKVRGGLDPEERIPATAIGFKTGAAFGADANGRLVEIRPKASRSALKVMASMLSTMRWMSLTTPQVQDLQWRSGAWQFNDGLGGHVHFGRKSPKDIIIGGRPTQKDEILALDQLAETLLNLGVYPKAECKARRQGGGRQAYGHLSDVRPQSYGYEYRTFPSWLDNPWSAFFTLTLSKLCVVDPDLLRDLMKDPPAKATNRIWNFLAYFKSRDDDANLAYSTLSRIGMPSHMGGDFKARWGAAYPIGTKTDHPVTPGSIDPSEVELKEVFYYFSRGEPLKTSVPPPNWGPSTPPPGYYVVLNRVNTDRVRGLGELVLGVLGSERLPVQVLHTDRHDLFTISDSLMREIGKNWDKKIIQWYLTHGDTAAHKQWYARNRDFMRCRVEHSDEKYIKVGTQWRGDWIKTTRKLLVEAGVFPLWRADRLPENAYERWKEKIVPAVEGEVIGEVIFAGGVLGE